MRADLATFLEKDSDYRLRRGVMPAELSAAYGAGPGSDSVSTATSIAWTALPTAKRRNHRLQDGLDQQLQA